jgi:hypothetical protein
VHDLGYRTLGHHALVLTLTIAAGDATGSSKELAA